MTNKKTVGAALAAINVAALTAALATLRNETGGTAPSEIQAAVEATPAIAEILGGIADGIVSDPDQKQAVVHALAFGVVAGIGLGEELQRGVGQTSQASS